MMLSVIVPVYNAEKYLGNCIESIISQEYKEIEIILVDDGSSDNSGKICDEFAQKDNRIQVLHQKNLGPLRARYNGVLASKGMYTTFVDADDWIDNNTYMNFLAPMEMEVDIIIYAKKVEREGAGIYHLDNFYQEGMYYRNDIEKKILCNAIWDFEKKSPGLTQSLNDKIFKKELLVRSYKQAENVPNIHYGEDPLILFPILQWVNSMYISHKCYYHYRKSVGNIPGYLKDSSFFEKANVWFQYLTDNTKEIPQIRKQLEYVYLYLLNLRKEIYGDLKKNDEYIFPFKDVKVGSKVVVYGAGVVGNTYIDQIKRSGYCEIIAWVDKNYMKYSESVSNPNYIEGLEFDCIVVAIQSEEIRQEVISHFKSKGYMAI